MNTNTGNYLRDTLSRLGGTSRSAWACLAVVWLRAGRRWVLLALIAVLNLLPAGRVTAQTFTTLHSVTASAGLILSGNTLYGTEDAGTVFALNTDGSGFTNLHSFTATSNNGFGDLTNSDGNGPTAGFIS